MTFRLWVFAILSLIVTKQWSCDFEDTANPPALGPGLMNLAAMLATTILFAVVVLRSLLVER